MAVDKSSHPDKLGYAGVRLRALWAMEKLSVWFCGLYTTPCLTGLLYGYDRVHFGSHRLPAGQVRAEPGPVGSGHQLHHDRRRDRRRLLRLPVR